MQETRAITPPLPGSALTIRTITHGTARQRGTGLVIHHGTGKTPFGPVHMARTDGGICWLAFTGECGLDEAMRQLRAMLPGARYIRDDAAIAPDVAAICDVLAGRRPDQALKLSLYGSNFQHQVWRALINLPQGQLASYGQIAGAIGAKGAARAVGAAVGANPVALLVPCHRVILASGAVHNYRWGTDVKQALIAAEGRS